MKKLLLFLFAAVAAMAQPFGAGVKVGVPFNDALEAVTSGSAISLTHPSRYIVGASAEVRLPLHLGVEFDALYRKLKYSGTFNLGAILNVSTDGSSWEFPLLLKYRFPTKVARPFLDAGVAWNRLSGVTTAVRTVAGGSGVPQSSNDTLRGFVTGVGVDVKVLVIHIQPEVRFTRWGAKQFFDASQIFRPNQNQGEFLLGISF